MTFVCSYSAVDAVLISADSLKGWTDGRTPETADKVFPLGHHALALSGSYWVAEYLKDKIVSRASELPGDVFNAAHMIARWASHAFQERYGISAFQSGDPYYSVDFGVYGWGDERGIRTNAQFELRSGKGFEARRHTKGVFALGTPQCEKAIADLILQGRCDLDQTSVAQVLYYTVARTIRRAPCKVGPPIQTFALRDCCQLQKVAIENSEAVISAYDNWFTHGLRAAP